VAGRVKETDMAVFDGLRVLDLTDASGVYGTKLLADLGADVIRLERPGGDPLRMHPPFLGGVPHPDRSLYWSYMNTSKRSMTLDLDTEDGYALFEELAGTAQVIAFGGTAPRFRELGLDLLAEARPDLVVSAVTPFGLTGPFQDWLGNDATGWGAGGITFTIGWPDRPPLTPGPLAQLAYIYSGYLAAFAPLAAVRTQRLSGTGQIVDVSVQQAVLVASAETGVSAFLDDSNLRPRVGNRRPAGSPFGHYETKDGVAAVLALPPAHWDYLAAWIHEKTGLEGVLDESLKGTTFNRTGDAKVVVDYFVEELAKLYTKQELFEEGQRRGVTITPVNDPASTAADPQLAHRGFWHDIDVDGTPVKAPGAPARYRTIRWEPRRAPRIGEHTAEVLGELGIDPERLGTLAAIGAI